ncbi:MAG TPA: GNAT family N-acetyltransferase [Vicinamibacteria bacterium]|nr:GNAT family N-acetyltransferase [Vicinamibacteria bacterium]
MKAIDLKLFEKRIKLRPIESKDFDQIIALHARCFPGMLNWTKEQLQSQIDTFPEGQLCIEHRGKIVASCSSLIVEFSEYSEWHNWQEISDNGYIRNHDPEGDTLYGMEMMVDPDYRGMKLARRLYDARKELVVERNLYRIIIGGRIPGYGKHSKKMTAREYVDDVLDKRLFDPVLTVQLANGFKLMRLIPDYLPDDDESRGYATFLEWVNIDCVADRRKRFLQVSSARITVVQYELRTIKSFDDFAQQCEFFVDVASDYKSDFVVFGELITAQLFTLIAPDRPELAARKLAELTPQYLDLFTNLAIRHDVNIIGGSQLLVEDDYLYNAAYLFRRDGTLERQYKIHITPSEKRWWGVQAGDEVGVFDTDCGKVAIFIGYDIQFPEIVRIAVEKGAQILFVPFNTDSREDYLRVRICAQARCIENHVYAAIAGCVGNMPFVGEGDVHYGQSGIYTPCDFLFSRDGVAAESMPNIETVVTHDVDTALLARHRLIGTVQNWNDRRLDLYRLTFGQDIVEAGAKAKDRAQSA